jgi:hypothetical protein
MKHNQRIDELLVEIDTITSVPPEAPDLTNNPYQLEIDLDIENVVEEQPPAETLGYYMGNPFETTEMKGASKKLKIAAKELAMRGLFGNIRATTSSLKVVEETATEPAQLIRTSFHLMGANVVRDNLLITMCRDVAVTSLDQNVMLGRGGELILVNAEASTGSLLRHYKYPTIMVIEAFAEHYKDQAA